MMQGLTRTMATRLHRAYIQKIGPYVAKWGPTQVESNVGVTTPMKVYTFCVNHTMKRNVGSLTWTHIPLNRIQARTLWTLGKSSKMTTSRVSNPNVSKRSYYYGFTQYQFQEGLRSNVIYQIGAVNLLIFCLWNTYGNTHSGRESMIKNFTISAQNLLGGRIWTLVTSGFSHQSLMHFGFNMLAFVSIGQGLRMSLGDKRVAALYLLGTVAASLAHAGWTSRQYNQLAHSNVYALTMRDKDFLMRGPPAGLGASGAVCAYLGTLAVLWPRQRLNLFFIFNPTASTVVMMIAAFDFIQLWNRDSLLGHSGHLGGIASGLLYGLMLKRMYRF